MSNREMARNRANEEDFDLAIIGGGITGAGIARDAAMRGLQVVLVEKNDFAYGTSSRSSKLIHGGIRYLQYFKLGLVMEACQERRKLREIAPHVVTPLPFLIPIYKGKKPRKLVLRLGLLFYDILSSFRNVKRHKFLNKKKILELAPNLRNEGLKGGAIYYDAQMDDARLCLENILSAQEIGAVVLNYTHCNEFLKDNAGRITGIRIRDLIKGDELSVKAKMVVNAAGPWVDNIMTMDSPHEKKELKISKGIHFFVPRVVENDYAIVVTLKDGRRVFVVPWKSMNLIGTTDTFYEGDIGNLSVERDEIEYLTQGIEDIFKDVLFDDMNIICSFAGVRPLVDPGYDASASEVSREHEIFESDSGLISIAGGKYTTYRTMAKEVVDLVFKRLKLPKKKCTTNKEPLYGGVFLKDWKSYIKTKKKDLEGMGVSENLAEDLLNIYGSKAEDVLLMAKGDADLERIIPELPYLWASVRYSVEREFSQSLSDFLWRRTQIAFFPSQGVAVVPKIAKRMGELLNWNSDDEKKQVDRYEKEIKLSKDFSKR